MTPTTDPVTRLRRFRQLTLAGGILSACAAGLWAFTPAPVPTEPARPVPSASAGPATRLVHPERWRIALAPMAAPPQPAPPEAVIPMAVISIMSRGGARQAMLSVGDGRLSTVTVGGTAAGWTVMAIDERSVTLDKGGTKRVVEMHP